MSGIGGLISPLSFQGVFTIDENVDNEITVVGTNRYGEAIEIAKLKNDRNYLSGSLENLTPQRGTLFIHTDSEGGPLGIPIRAYDVIYFDRMKVLKLSIATNGVMRLVAVGIAVQTKDEVGELAVLNRSRVWREGRNPKNVPIRDTNSIDSDITTATTTQVIAGITDLRHLRVNKLYISVAGANNVELRYERDGSTQYIGQIQFNAAGFAIIDDLPPCYLGADQDAPNDVNLEVITSTTAATNVSGSYAEE